MPSTSLFGDNYPYYNYIKTPVDLKMSTKGDLATVGKDIIGLGAYAATLATGGDLNGTWATTVKRPLGNKYFLQSGGKCNDVKTELEVDRYIYVNNVPMGRIPFISSLINANFTDMRGLIPGTIEQLNVFNPVAIIRGLASGSKPDCQELTMQTTIDALQQQVNDLGTQMTQLAGNMISQAPVDTSVLEGSDQATVDQATSDETTPDETDDLNMS